MPVEPASFVENVVFFPLDGFSNFVKDQLTINMWVHFWVFNYIPLIFLPVTVTTAYRFSYYCSAIQLEFRDGDFTQKFFYLLSVVFNILGFWLLKINL